MNQRKIRLVILSIVVLPFIANAQTFNYEIKGEIKGLKNDTVMLNIVSGNENTIKIPANNDRFEYKGTTTGYYAVFAEVVHKRNNGNFSFFLDKGTIIIKGDNSTKLTDVQVIGTPVNDEYNAGLQKQMRFYNRRDSLYKLTKGLDKNDAVYKDLMAKIDNVMDEFKSFRINYIEHHPASMFSAMSLYVLSNGLPGDKLDQLYSNLQFPAKDLSLLKDTRTLIEAKRASEKGKPAPDFSMKDMNGKIIKLSDYKGKYVLIDFWASWCVPCRAESAGLVRAYKKYKDKSFEIISVSSDSKEADWRKAIADDKLNEWIHVCDFKGLKNQIAVEYGVQPIPDNFLIDPSGKIIGRQLLGDDLERELGAVMRK